MFVIRKIENRQRIENRNPSGGIFVGGGISGESHMGTTKLMTKAVPTKERSWADILFNWTKKIITP